MSKKAKAGSLRKSIKFINSSKTDAKLYAKKFNNLGEIHRILKRNKLLKLNQEETDNLNNPTFTKETDLWLKTSSQRKPKARKASLTKHLKKKK